jgi:hypothetical protein
MGGVPRPARAWLCLGWTKERGKGVGRKLRAEITYFNLAGFPEPPTATYLTCGFKE